MGSMATSISPAKSVQEGLVWTDWPRVHRLTCPDSAQIVRIPNAPLEASTKEALLIHFCHPERTGESLSSAVKEPSPSTGESKDVRKTAGDGRGLASADPSFQTVLQHVPHADMSKHFPAFPVILAAIRKHQSHQAVGNLASNKESDHPKGANKGVGVTAWPDIHTVIFVESSPEPSGMRHPRSHEFGDSLGVVFECCRRAARDGGWRCVYFSDLLTTRQAEGRTKLGEESDQVTVLGSFLPIFQRYEPFNCLLRRLPAFDPTRGDAPSAIFNNEEVAINDESNTGEKENKKRIVLLLEDMGKDEVKDDGKEKEQDKEDRVTGMTEGGTNEEGEEMWRTGRVCQRDILENGFPLLDPFEPAFISQKSPAIKEGGEPRSGGNAAKEFGDSKFCGFSAENHPDFQHWRDLIGEYRKGLLAEERVLFWPFANTYNIKDDEIKKSLSDGVGAAASQKLKMLRLRPPGGAHALRRYELVAFFSLFVAAASAFPGAHRSYPAMTIIGSNNITPDDGSGSTLPKTHCLYELTWDYENPFILRALAPHEPSLDSDSISDGSGIESKDLMGRRKGLDALWAVEGRALRQVRNLPDADGKFHCISKSQIFYPYNLPSYRVTAPWEAVDRCLDAVAVFYLTANLSSEENECVVTELKAMGEIDGNLNTKKDFLFIPWSVAREACEGPPPQGDGGPKDMFQIYRKVQKLSASPAESTSPIVFVDRKSAEDLKVVIADFDCYFETDTESDTGSDTKSDGKNGNENGSENDDADDGDGNNKKGKESDGGEKTLVPIAGLSRKEYQAQIRELEDSDFRGIIYARIPGRDAHICHANLSIGNCSLDEFAEDEEVLRVQRPDWPTKR